MIGPFSHYKYIKIVKRMNVTLYEGLPYRCCKAVGPFPGLGCDSLG